MPGATPVVAVIPAKSGAGEGADELALGLLQDVCGELTRFRGLEVISWMSGIGVTELPDSKVGEGLGATHVLRGELRRSDQRLRVRATLIDCETGKQLWVEAFDSKEEEFFSIQDDIVARIAASLSRQLEETALRDASSKPTDSLEAYELTLRGMMKLREATVEADEEARIEFERALDLDPTYARAYAGISLSWFNEWSCQFWDKFQANGQKAYSYAHSALELDDRDAFSHVIVGKVLCFRREFERTAWYFDRALALCPNDAEMLIWMSSTERYLSRPTLAVQNVERAMRLNPLHPSRYYAFAALAHAAAKNYERAIELAGFAPEAEIADVPAYVAIACAHTGRREEGLTHLQTFLDFYRSHIVHSQEASLEEACGWLTSVNPYRYDADRDFVVEGFKLLGAFAKSTSVGEPEAQRTLRVDDKASLYPEGSQWLATFAGRSVIVPDLKGLHDIRRLLTQPGEEVHCVDLADRGEDGFLGDEVLDERARSALKERLRDLQEDLVEAEDMHDLGRAEKLKEEMDQLLETLSSALGLGGRSRRLGDAAEKARTTVAWRVRHALKRLRETHPELGQHLLNSIRTGAFCSYRPDRVIDWHLAPSAEAGSGPQQR